MRRREKCSNEDGIALFFLAALLFLLLAFAGLAVDLGRGYIVKAHLAKAVDGAALAGARVIGDGQSAARAEANKIFNANFPNGYIGVSSIQNPPNVAFDYGADGSNIVTVSSNAVLPTTFMTIAGFNKMDVSSSGQATKRLVDLALVVDKSGSLGSVWPQVQSAAQQFVNYFDENSDRVSLTVYSTNTTVMDAMRSPGRGFSKSAINGHIAAVSSGGNTGTAEGLYQGWDQLRTVPYNTQSGLRIIVLFTDGSPNAISGDFNVSNGGGGFVPRTGALYTGDFPEYIINGNRTGVNNPEVTGLREVYGTVSDQSLRWVSPTSSSYSSGQNVNIQIVNQKIPELPTRSNHPQHASAAIPFAFNLYDPALPGQRPLIDPAGIGYKNHVQNANNAARNLLESIANAAKSDTSGAYRIRIYTLGLGDILNQNMGASAETGSSILQRVANDPASPDFNASQPAGKYYFAGDPTQLNAAFEAVRNQILRLSQ